MPLWEFTNERAKSRAVTAIAWSPRYFDMFAVGYGSFDFLKPTTGGCWAAGLLAAGSGGLLLYFTASPEEVQVSTDLLFVDDVWGLRDGDLEAP